MTFPIESTQPMLANALREIQSGAGSIMNRATLMRDKSAAGSVFASEIFDLHRDLKSRLDRMVALRSISGLAQYAKDQFDDQAFDVVAEFNAMEVEIQDTLDWIRTNLPASAAGFAEFEKIEADDTVTLKSFAPGATAGLRTQLDLLIATIG